MTCFPLLSTSSRHLWVCIRCLFETDKAYRLLPGCLPTNHLTECYSVHSLKQVSDGLSDVELGIRVQHLAATFGKLLEGHYLNMFVKSKIFKWLFEVTFEVKMHLWFQLLRHEDGCPSVFDIIVSCISLGCYLCGDCSPNVSLCSNVLIYYSLKFHIQMIQTY